MRGAYMKEDTQKDIFNINLEEQLHEAKMIYVLKGPITLSLYDTLEKYDKDHLEFMLDEHIDMNQSYTKSELILLLEKELTNPILLNTLFLVMKEKETSFLNDLIEHDSVVDKHYALSQIDFILDRGLAYAYYIDNQFVYVMPKEIKAAYHRLSSEDAEIEKDTVTYMNQFMEATVNLYGAIYLDEVIRIYNQLHVSEHSKLTQNALDDFFSIAFMNLPGYIIIGDILAHEIFEDEEEIEVMEAILDADVPYYVPDLDSYLMHSDEYYYETNEAYETIVNYLRQGWVHADDEMEDAIQDIIMMLRLEAEEGIPETLIPNMAEMGILFADDEAIEAFIGMYMEFVNHTRMWKNHGFTPDEIVEYTATKKSRN